MVLKMLKLCFGLLLLAAVTNGEFEVLKAKIEELIQTGELIDDLFKLLKYVDEGGFGVVYKGERTSDNFSIAMKFSPWEHKSEVDREFRTYAFLRAVNRMEVEQYGISPILYYKVLEWDNEKYVMVAFSFFDGGQLLDLSKKGYFTHGVNDPNVINSLIVFRDYIRQSKYMHSCGMRHDDLKPENIMFRKHRSFLIDFNLSNKMRDPAIGNTLEYASRRCHDDSEMYPLDDWESFLYTMCQVNRVPLEWFNEAIYEKLNMFATFRLAADIKKNVTNTIHYIFDTIKSPALKAVYYEFVEEVFRLPANSTPRYDHMMEVINTQIKSILKPKEIAMVTWLSNDEKKEAIKDITNNPLPDISTLNVPEDFTTFKYPPVRYNVFNKKPTMKPTRTKTLTKRKTPTPSSKGAGTS